MLLQQLPILPISTGHQRATALIPTQQESPDSGVTEGQTVIANDGETIDRGKGEDGEFVHEEIECRGEFRGRKELCP